MLKNLGFIFSFVLMLMASCTFNAKIKDTGAPFLQGEWIEDSVENAGEMVSYEQFRFRFVCDSFYLEIDSYSKVNLQGGECYDQKRWKEYAKGTYFSSNDTLSLKGAYVSESYRFKPEGACYRFGKLEEDYLLFREKNGLIVLKHMVSHAKHILHQSAKGQCTIDQ